MALNYKPDLTGDLRRAAQVAVILTTMLLMLGALWLGPTLGDWLVANLAEPEHDSRINHHGHPWPWPARMQLVATALPALHIGVAGLFALVAIDGAVKES